jgi:hypothetical protein
MNMRIERNIVQPALNETLDGAGKSAAKGKVAGGPNVTVEHVAAGDHRGGLGPLGIDELMPPPQPNALAALQPMPPIPPIPPIPAMEPISPMPPMPAMEPVSGNQSTQTTSGVGSSSPPAAQSSDFATKVGSPDANSAAAIMLEVGLAEIQSNQTMAKSQEEARESDVASYSAKIDGAVQELKDQAHNEVQSAWIEGVVGGVGAALSLAGSVGGAFAAAPGYSFGANLLGGTETGAGLLSTSGGLMGTLSDAIIKGTAGKAETKHVGQEKADEKAAAIFQSASASAQEYRDKYWDMQQKALSAVQAVIQGQGQAGQAVASNV